MTSKITFEVTNDDHKSEVVIGVNSIRLTAEKIEFEMKPDLK